MKKIFKNFRNNIKDLDKILFFVSLVLVIWGMLNIVTASSSESVDRYQQNLYHYFNKQFIFACLGFIAGTVIIMVPTKYYKLFTPVLYIGISIACIGAVITGAKRGSANWFLGFQPSELAKPIIIATLAIFYEQFYKQLHTKELSRVKYIGIAIVLTFAIPIIVVALQKDMGTGAIIALISGTLFLVSPIKRKDKFFCIIGGTILLALVVGTAFLMKGYIFTNEQLSRLTNFQAPCDPENYRNDGYQICKGYIAINNGGLFGLGLGKSKQKYSYIPDPHTDSVFAIIAEELGLIKSSIIFILYFILLKRLSHWANKATSISGKYICLGIGTYFLLHITINLGGLFGLIPLTGVPLPFFTYGGSSIISIICSLAIVQRVVIETKRKKIKIK